MLALSQAGQTSVIPSRLARSRPRFAAYGLDGLPLARQGLAVLVRLNGEAERFLILIRDSEKAFSLLVNARCLETSPVVGNQPAEPAGSKYFHATLRRLDFLTSVLFLFVVLRSMDLMSERAGMPEEEEKKRLCPANDNVSPSALSLDPRILRIAEAIGRQIAREQAKPPAANDNEPGPR